MTPAKAKAPVIGPTEALFETRTFYRTDNAVNFTTTSKKAATPARAEMFSGVPYITHLAGQPYSGIDCFDVPAETYTAGNQTGIQAAAHLFKVTRDVEEGFLVASIRAACRIAEEADAAGFRPGAVDKGGAAIGFLSAIEHLLTQACKELDFSSIISESLKAYEAGVEQDLEEMRARRAALMQFMSVPEKAAA